MTIFEKIIFLKIYKIKKNILKICTVLSVHCTVLRTLSAGYYRFINVII